MNPNDLAEAELEPERYELYAEPRYRFAPDRRDFLKTLGAGIVVGLLVEVEQSEAQPPAGRGRGRGRGFGGGAMPQDLGAWLHIDEKGTVTVSTGKVEVGQNVRTLFTQVVAEELRLPVSAVRLVMADTDRVPFDTGTFGSGSTPRMAPQLARVAAAARELLLDLAAEQLQAARGTLVFEGGQVTNPATKTALTFSELTRGQKLTKTVAADQNVTPVDQWKVLGTPVPKVEGRAIVTGRHKFSSDIKLPDMLYGKVLRSPLLGGKLASADTTAAAVVPGVTVVRDGNFVGVAAPHDKLAEQALAAIKAEWNYAPQVSSKDLFKELKTARGEGRGLGGGGRGFGGGGVQGRGSIEQGLAAADHKLEATFTIAYIAHAPLEPRAAVAEWKDDKLTVWTGTQVPFGVRGNLSDAFGLPPERVRVIVPDTGSGYGGKHRVEAAIEAARLAKAAGKPVKLVYTREEEFTWAYFRPAGVIDVTAGVTKEGALTAWEFHNYNSGGSAIQTLYDAANVRTEFHSSRSPLEQGSYRALAATANTFARESAMDDLAHAAGINPLEFRLKNLKDARLRAVLEAAAKQLGWGQAQPAPGRGIGIAGGSEKGSYVATGADVVVDRASGKVQIARLVTAFECGAVRNPDHLKNQVEGAVVMGLGGALFEAIEFEEGRILTDRFSRYRVPRFSDVPLAALETVLVDRRDLPSTGAGETPIIAVAPAIGNAIFQATGLRLRSLPMLPNGLPKL
jgi:isoquinoline 1-oxidoreductase